MTPFPSFNNACGAKGHGSLAFHDCHPVAFSPWPIDEVEKTHYGIRVKSWVSTG